MMAKLTGKLVNQPTRHQLPSYPANVLIIWSDNLQISVNHIVNLLDIND